MKIIAQESDRGKKYILPDLGEVEIPEDGILEFENEETAKSLVESCIGYSFFKEDKGEEDKGQEGGGDVGQGEDDPKIREQLLAKLQEMSLEELVELAQQSDLNEKEWGKLAKNSNAGKAKEFMLKYLQKNLK